MPEPREGERRIDFLQRCMNDEEARADFPDQKQRYAFCMSQWEGRKAMPVYKRMDASAKRDGDRIVFVLSDETPDRDGEIIKHTAWRNTGGSIPFLFGHDKGNMRHVLGKLHIHIDKGLRALVGEPVFADTPSGKEARSLVTGGSAGEPILDTVSIGFNPYAWTDDGGDTVTKRDDGDSWPVPRKERVYLDADPLEASLVPVPSNPNARQRCMDAMVKAFEHPKLAIEFLEDTRETSDPVTLDAVMKELRSVRSLLNQAIAISQDKPISVNDWFQHTSSGSEYE